MRARATFDINPVIKRIKFELRHDDSGVAVFVWCVVTSRPLHRACGDVLVHCIEYIRFTSARPHNRKIRTHRRHTHIYRRAPSAHQQKSIKAPNFEHSTRMHALAPHACRVQRLKSHTNITCATHNPPPTPPPNHPHTRPLLQCVGIVRTHTARGPA